jgi:deoxyribodipyrimidine photo-lyase
LIIRHGPWLAALQELIKETGAQAVFWSRRYEPRLIARDQQVQETLRATGLHVESSNASLLREPMGVRNQSGKPFQVFTPFWKHCLAQGEISPPLPAPDKVPAPAKWPKSLTLAALDLLPKIAWAGGLEMAWKIGATAAQKSTHSFAAKAWPTYGEERNRPDHGGTSRLSPHLHFGEISPREVWWHLKSRAEKTGLRAWEKTQFVTEIGWREFAYHLLFHFPHTPDAPLRAEWDAFPVAEDQAGLAAWSRGRTGYPIVDAGMRELWSTGWMHNRVRMIVGSFLVKDLFLPWQEGARWFWDTLVDADLASNTLGWQWVAGCGADAAPYFRVFNPVSQGQKFDPQGDYVRKWIPELKHVPNEFVHAPWTAPLGKVAGYPGPIVDHAKARERALAAYAALRAAVKRGQA